MQDDLKILAAKFADICRDFANSKISKHEFLKKNIMLEDYLTANGVPLEDFIKLTK